MRATFSVVWVPAATSRRTKRAAGAVTVRVVTLSVLAVTASTVVQVVPSGLTATVKSRVLYATGSPPAPACRTTIRRTCAVASRSTRSDFEAAAAHHLSPLPPDHAPLTARSGASAGAHAALPVTGFFNARFSPA